MKAGTYKNTCRSNVGETDDNELQDKIMRKHKGENKRGRKGQKKRGKLIRRQNELLGKLSLSLLSAPFLQGNPDSKLYPRVTFPIC